MANTTAAWRLWGEKFKAFRLRAGYASQHEWADALSHLTLVSGNNLILSVSQISRWENGQRCPFRREQHLALIEGLVRLGGIHTPEEANVWLHAGNQGGLSAEERRLLFADVGAAQAQPSHQAELASPFAPIQRVTPGQEWGDAPVRAVNGRGFHGRQDELAHLGRWLVDDGCRLLAIVGMGGVGKTALAARLAGETVRHFDGVLWRSLLNAPPVEDTLRAWLSFLSCRKVAALPAAPEEALGLLLDYLRKHRCLLVLDNCEAVLQGGEQAGQYLAGYEDYGQLLRWLAVQEHRSCVLLTSRERPHELTHLERESACVRCFDLTGLTLEAGRTLIHEQGVQTTDDLGNDLVARYSGNPLALMLVADTIQELFDGDVAAFLGHETPLFDDIRKVLDQQFGRLSPLEGDLVIWLAVEREPVSLPALERDLAQPISRGEALAALRALQRRSLVERVDSGSQGVRFTLQNVVTEYAGERLIAAVYREILTGKAQWLNRYALLKAQAKEYVRQSQARLLLQPLARRLATGLGRLGLDTRLKSTLTHLRAETPLAPGYAAGNILNLLLHMGHNVRGYDFSHLSVWQAYLRGMAVQDVNLSHADLAEGVFTDIIGSINSVTFSPDGEHLAAATGQGAIHLWQTATGRTSLTPYIVCVANTHAVFSISFSPDCRTLASGGLDRRVRLWDVATGACLYILQGHSRLIRTVCFSPDGRTLATGGDDCNVRLWDVETGELLHILQEHTSVVRAVCFSADGCTLASGGDDQTVWLWDIARISRSGARVDEAREPLRILQGHTEPVFSVSFGPDGRTLVSGSADHTVRLWDVKTGACRHILPGHTGAVFSAGLSPDGRTLASGSADHTVRLWDVETGACRHILQGHTRWVSSLCFSKDGTLASGSGDQTVRLWDVQTGQSLHTLQGYSTWARSVFLSRDGRTLASGGDDQTVHLWDIQTGAYLHSLQGHTSPVWSVSLSPDGRSVASGSGDQTVRLWDVESGACRRILEGHTSLILSVCFSPDSRTLASGGEDETVRLWNVETGACLHSLPHTSWLTTVYFSPNGRILASGSGDHIVRLWDVQTGQSLYHLEGHRTWVKSVFFSEDGRTLFSASADGTVRVWDVESGTCLRILQKYDGWFKAVCFGADGRILASGSENQTVRLFDVESGECLQSMQGHADTALSLCFSADGRSLVSAGLDGTVRLWDVETGACFRSLRSDRPYERMNITGVTGLTAGQVATLKALGAVEHPSTLKV